MRIIGGIGETTTARIGRRVPRRPAGAVGEGVPPHESRALVPVAPAAASEPERPLGRRPSAVFLAHLIASAQQVPQTRARRRAEPADAMAAYRAAGEAVHAFAGPSLRLDRAL